MVFAQVKPPVPKSVPSYGKNALARVMGRDQADHVWADVRQAAISSALANAKTGDLADAAKAKQAAEQARKAFTAGYNLADMRVTAARRKADERLAQVR